MKQELKRCPFCGGYAVYKYEDRQDGADLRKYVYIMCSNCAVSTMTSPVKDLCSEYPDKYSPKFPDIYEPYDGEKEVAQTWNRRINDTTPTKKNNLFSSSSIDDVLRIMYKMNGEYSFALDCTRYYDYEIETIEDIIRLSPEELCAAVGETGEKGYNEVIDILRMCGIDTKKYTNYQYKKDVLAFHISELPCRGRAMTALIRNNMRRIGDVARLSPEELKQVKGLGEKGYNEVVKALSAVGIDTSKYTK